MTSNSISAQNAANTDEIDLFAILHQIKANFWLILVLTAISVSVGVLYCLRLVPQYQSHVLIQIDTKQQALGQGAVAQQFLLGNGGGASSATQIALIQSPFILGPVIEQLGLDIQATQDKKSIWQRMFNRTSPYSIKVTQLKVPQDLINKSLILKVVNATEISLYAPDHRFLLRGPVGRLISSQDKSIQVNVSSIHAPKGAQFKLVKSSESSVLSDLAGRLKINESTGSLRESTGIIDISLSGSDIQQVMRILDKIAEVTRLKDAQKKAEEASQTLDFLYHQLPLTKRSLEKAENALNLYRARSGKIDIKLQTQFYLNQLTTLDKQLGSLRIKKIQMLQQYTLEHPKMKALATQTHALVHQRNELEHQIKLLPASDQIALNLMRDVSVKKTLYMILLNKIQELRVVKAGTVSSVRILNYAKLPDHPLPLKRAMICLASMIIGLILSAFVILARKALDRRIFDPHWSEHHFNVPNVAIVPFSDEQFQKNKVFKLNQSKKIMLLAHESPKNLSVESMRSLRTSLQVSLLSANNNIVSILGVTPGVGKSFTSTNLAYLLASAGKRVVLVDGDLRKGTVHRYFDALPQPGLAEVLNQTADLNKILQSKFNANLFFIPRGSYPKDPSELLMSDQFKDTMQTLSQTFDVVIIDTPPVLLVTDAAVISAMSSINYLVLGAGAHEAADIEIVLKRLDTSGVKLHGTIFNFNREQRKHSAYGRYGSYMGYGKYNKYHYYYDDTAAETK